MVRRVIYPLGLLLAGAFLNHMYTSILSTSRILNGYLVASKSHSNANANANYDKDIDSPASQVTFLMILGVEGTGHHFFEQLYKASPSFHDHDYNILKRPLFYVKQKHKGLWSAPCAEVEDNSSMRTEGRSPYDEVVRLLHDIESKWKNKSNRTTAFPISPSYPMFMGPCRPLQYPDVDLLYAACKDAGVSCKHIVMTRDPHEVIRSTTVNRKFSGKNMQIKLLTTMLDVINTHLLSHREGFLAHWQYGDAMPNPVLGHALGFDSAEQFSEAYAEAFRAPKIMSDEEKKELIPAYLQPYMDVFARSMDRVKLTCQLQESSN